MHHRLRHGPIKCTIASRGVGISDPERWNERKKQFQSGCEDPSFNKKSRFSWNGPDFESLQSNNTMDGGCGRWNSIRALELAILALDLAIRTLELASQALARRELE